MTAAPVQTGITGSIAFVLNASGDVSEFPIPEADDIRQKVLDGLLLGCEVSPPRPDAGGRPATDVGVPFQVPGLALHRQLARPVEAGLTPLEALKTATLNPARVLGLADSLGTIERANSPISFCSTTTAGIANTQWIRSL